MIAMLGCSSPSEITRALDKLNITRSTFKADNDFTDFDDEQVPGLDYHGGGGGGGGRTRYSIYILIILKF
jgi:hypothetical protein